MPTISAGEFRKGMIFEMEGKPMLVVDFQHVKPGKGAAFVRTKYKNVITGAIREESFNPTAKFEQASVERKDAEYSYNDGDLYYFMDPETYDMSPLNRDVLGEAFKFMKENTVCKLVSYKGSVFTVEVPNFMDLEVTETELVGSYFGGEWSVAGGYRVGGGAGRASSAPTGGRYGPGERPHRAVQRGRLGPGHRVY